MTSPEFIRMWVMFVVETRLVVPVKGFRNVNGIVMLKLVSELDQMLV